MANQVEITITADPKNAEAGFKKVKSGFQGMKDSILKNKKAIGLGVMAMGAGIEGLARSQAPLTEATKKLANQTGFAEDAIRDMATELSNATFPLESALALMETGAQQGLESAAALKEYANFWDTVGDATGLGAEELAKAAAGLKAVGVSAGEEGELLSAFGLIQNESTLSVKEFIDMVGKLAPEMTAMGLSVDDAATFVTTMQRELGLTAKVAQAEFKVALQQSTTGLDGVKEALGLTDAQLEKYRQKLEESSGVIQENADAHMETKTSLEKLKSAFDDVIFANGEWLAKAAEISPLLLATGPIIAGFNIILGFMTPVLTAVKAQMIALNLSMGPIALVIIGIAAAITAAILIWKNWDKIILALKKTLEVLKATFKTVFDFIKEIVSKVFAKITDLYNSKLGWLLPGGSLIKAISFLENNWNEIWDGIQTKFKTVTDALVATFQSVKGTILGIWDGMVSGIKGAINSVIGTINGFIQRINSIRITVPGVDIPGVGRVGGFSVGMPTIPEIPSLAKGGIVNRPTLAMLGESGPEAVVPLGRGRGVGMTINLVINGDVNGFDDFQQKVTSVIRDAVLGGGFSGVLARA